MLVAAFKKQRLDRQKRQVEKCLGALLSGERNQLLTDMKTAQSRLREPNVPYYGVGAKFRRLHVFLGLSEKEAEKAPHAMFVLLGVVLLRRSGLED